MPPADALLQRLPIPLLWLLWAGYWWLSARDVKATMRSEPSMSRWLHLGPLLIAGALIWTPRTPWPALDVLFRPAGHWQYGVGVTLTAGGLAFAVWARRHIGRNWSAIVTLKDGHELVTSGPYALVRHPIYTGLLLAFLGSALARGQWRGLLAVAIAALALLRKSRLEERWMRERFGAAYDDYCRRVKALVPLLF
jgi:protein-S-isoprenylcysteine O-methyltransferase Ste14